MLDRQIGILGVSLLIAGCVPGIGTDEAATDGSLGCGRFVYSCSDAEADAVCHGPYGSDNGENYPDGMSGIDETNDAGITRTGLPVIAVGSRFQLRFEATQSCGYGADNSLTSSAPDRLRRLQESTIEVVSEGSTAVLAMKDGSKVADFTHIVSREVNRVVVKRAGETEPVDEILLRIGESVLFSARVQADDFVLGGTHAFKYAVESANAAVSLRDMDGTTGTWGLSADAVGEAVLRISVGGYTREVPVRVTAAPHTDTDTDTDTDTAVDAGEATP